MNTRDILDTEAKSNGYDLSFIKIINSRILIDNGSNTNFLRKEKIPDDYIKYIQIMESPIKIISCNKTDEVNSYIDIPNRILFSEESLSDFTRFYIYNFHAYFDGLIGNPSIRKLWTGIDLVNSQLLGHYTNIRMHYRLKFEKMIPGKVNPWTMCLKYIPIKNNTHSDGKYLLKRVNLTPNVYIESGNFRIIKDHVECLIFNESNDPFFIRDLTLMPHCFTPIIEIKEIQNIEIRDSHLESHVRSKLHSLINKYDSIFPKEGQKLTFTNQVKHVIKTVDEQPVFSKLYRYPPIHDVEVQNQVRSMLEQGIIRPSNSPYCSPLWVVPKKKDASGKTKWRVVIDYKNLNEKTISDKYPLPNIEDLLDQLNECKYFTALDLSSGFHQIEMDPNSIAKTAFNAGTHGHYEYLRMPFGLKNAPATFQRCVNHVLQGIPNVRIYIDDILIYTKTIEEHFRILELVFTRLQEYNLLVQLDKSEFLKTSTTYLGHIISEEGIQPNPEKIKAVKDFPIPKTTKQIKGFLGLTGYYRKFIKDYAKVAKPLTECLKKDAVINNKDIRFIEAFELLKTQLVNEPILSYPNFTKEFILTTDASDFAIGSVLSQGNVPNDKPVAYFSRTLNGAEKNYSTIEKELFSILQSVKHFRPYLFGQKFIIYTDHAPLQWLMNIKEPNSRLLRWRLRLEEFEYEIRYKAGKQNTNADALSRIEINNNEEEVDELNMSFHSINTDDINSNLSFPSEELNEQPPISNHDNSPGTVHTAIQSETPGIEINEFNILNTSKYQILVIKVDSPKDIKIEKIHKKTRYTLYVHPGTAEKTINIFIKEFIRPLCHYQIYFTNDNDNSLYILFSQCIQKNFSESRLKIVKVLKFVKDVLMEEEQEEITLKFHEGLTNHRGINALLEEIRKEYYWPNMSNTVSQIVNACDLCRCNKYDRHPQNPPIQETETPELPMKIIHMDTVAIENNNCLTIIDRFTKFATCKILPSKNSSVIIKHLLEFFAAYGIPDKIVTDNGSEFKNAMIKEFLKNYNINIHFCCVDHPQSNGTVERFHSTLREHIRLVSHHPERKKLPLLEKISYCLIAYNNTVHSETKYTPNELLFGHKITHISFENKTSPTDYINEHLKRMSVVHQTASSTQRVRKCRRNKKLNMKRKPPDALEEGEPVYTTTPFRTNLGTKNQPRFTKENVIKDNGINVELTNKRKTDKIIHKKNIQRKRKTKS